METIANRPGRPATGRTTMMVRIPKALHPAVTELIETYRLAKKRAWDAQPLRKPEQPDDDAGLVAAAELALDRLARGEETTISFEDWERRHGLGG